MKPIKMFGLAVLAALATMAFGAASPAAAETTVLCAEDESPCEAANVVTHVHEVTEEGNKAVLLSSAGTVECDALFLGEVLEETSEPLVIHGNFTYTKCERNGSSCTVIEESEDTLIEVLRLGHELADVTGKGEFNVHCGLFINCTYNGENLEGHGLGPLLASSENGEVSITEQETHKVSGLCSEIGNLDITTMPLEAVYLAADKELHYCIEVEHAGHGLYEDNECKVQLPSRTGNFELVEGPPGLLPGTTVCEDLKALAGLWKDSKCTSDDSSNASKYEKGKVVKVQ